MAREQRLDLRLTADDKSLLKRAAEADGRDVTSFVLEAARAAARETLERQRRIALSARDAARVLELLESPPPPSAELLAAAKAHLSGKK
jgi:uncharacterized protein (DUF1778 family)